jgi:hypothetical protein
MHAAYWLLGLVLLGLVALGGGCASTLQNVGEDLNDVRAVVVEHCVEQPQPATCSRALPAFNRLATKYTIANEVGR